MNIYFNEKKNVYTNKRVFRMKDKSCFNLKWHERETLNFILITNIGYKFKIQHKIAQLFLNFYSIQFENKKLFFFLFILWELISTPNCAGANKSVILLTFFICPLGQFSFVLCGSGIGNVKQCETIQIKARVTDNYIVLENPKLTYYLMSSIFESK